MDTCMSKADVIRNDSDELMPLDSALSFGEFLRVVLRLRGGNAVRVTDMVDLREFVKKSLDTHREYMGQRLRLLEQEILGSRACPHEAPLSEHVDANTNNSAVSAMKQARDGTKGKRVFLVSENAEDVASWYPQHSTCSESCIFHGGSRTSAAIGFTATDSPAVL